MLTKKQEKYVQALIKGKSQREAYKIAYNAAKMKDETIDKRASELMKNGEVTGRYNELMAAAIAKGEVQAVEVRKQIIIQLMKILQADIKDYYSFSSDKHGSSKGRLKDLTNVDTKAIQQLSRDKEGNTKIRLYDKLAAIRELKEIFQITEERTDDKDTIVINVPREFLS